MSYKEFDRLEYLDTLLFLMDGGYIDASGASAQYWEDFGLWDKFLKTYKEEY